MRGFTGHELALTVSIIASVYNISFVQLTVDEGAWDRKGKHGGETPQKRLPSICHGLLLDGSFPQSFRGIWLGKVLGVQKVPGMYFLKSSPLSSRDYPEEGIGNL